MWAYTLPDYSEEKYSLISKLLPCKSLSIVTNMLELQLLPQHIELEADFGQWY